LPQFRELTSRYGVLEVKTGLGDDLDQDLAR
jgi:hypothetical protein